MFAKSTKVVLGVLTLLSITFFVFKPKKKNLKDTQIKIGIIQTASHPALDAVREGFTQELSKLLNNNVEFIVNNAQGSVANAHTIAQRFHSDTTINGIFAIATPATQAISAVEKEKPIFIAAVTDPQKLGVIHPTTNVTGTRDMINVPDTIAMIRAFIPKAQTVALLYNTGEANSLTLIEKMKEELTKNNLSFIDAGITSEADIAPAVEAAARRADLLLAPTDNTVASAITLIASIVQKYPKPLIVSDNLLVVKGALAARGVNYYESGKQAAHIAYEVLAKGRKPFEIAIADPAQSSIMVNKKVLESLGLAIPEELKEEVKFIE